MLDLPTENLHFLKFVLIILNPLLFYNTCLLFFLFLSLPIPHQNKLDLQTHLVHTQSQYLKVCNGTAHDEFIHSGNIKQFEKCTKVMGNIQMFLGTFAG